MAMIDFQRALPFFCVLVLVHRDIVFCSLTMMSQKARKAFGDDIVAGHASWKLHGTLRTTTTTTSTFQQSVTSINHTQLITPRVVFVLLLLNLQKLYPLLPQSKKKKIHSRLHHDDKLRDRNVAEHLGERRHDVLLPIPGSDRNVAVPTLVLLCQQLNSPPLGRPHRRHASQ